MNGRRSTSWATAGLAVVAGLALGACGNDDEGPIPQTGIRQTTTAPSSTTTTTTPATTEIGGASTTTTPSTTSTTAADESAAPSDSVVTIGF
ncbi:MAG TPA: hypothetical protein VE623_10275 [Acidimicrobiales bacterium]|nr:hypothetical protein [Acidimicrobiales bacterium]